MVFLVLSSALATKWVDDEIVCAIQNPK